VSEIVDDVCRQEMTGCRLRLALAALALASASFEYAEGLNG
jgi:hypothetical protein